MTLQFEYQFKIDEMHLPIMMIAFGIEASGDLNKDMEKVAEAAKKVLEKSLFDIYSTVLRNVIVKPAEQSYNEQKGYLEAALSNNTIFTTSIKEEK